jgi:2-oxoglutarate dehydrogenase E2 component (dihydrolipoamide succinyltransferase)
MIVELKIPSPGESITEVEIANWFVQDGDHVTKDQEVGEIESDKATLPLLAPEKGAISLKIAQGEKAKVGDVACTVDTSVQAPATKENDSPSTDQPGNAPVETISSTVETKSTQSSVSDASKVKISPLAKKLMDENNLDIEQVLEGLKRIGTREVEQAIEALKKPAEQVAKKPLPGERVVDRKKMSVLRRKISERLVAVKNETAMLTTFNEVDMSEIIQLRKKYQTAFEKKHGVKLGFMSLFAKAVSRALESFPQINSRIEEEDIVTPHFHDIGIAMQSDKGLMVPVVRNVESMSLAGIELGIAELAVKARSGRISIEEMTGGTFTITNGGVFGSMLSTPILNPPQSAILGMHNIIDRPVAIQGKVEIRPMMYLALSYDHRVIDGKDSVSFLVKVKEYIESPWRMLLNGMDPDKALLDL